MRLARIFLAIFAVVSFGLCLLLRWYLVWPWLVCWLIPANLTAFALWAYDKRQSTKQARRVPEFSLHAMALLGATPASFLAMGLLRHKNLKTSFHILYAFFLVVQALALVLLF